VSQEHKKIVLLANQRKHLLQSDRLIKRSGSVSSAKKINLSKKEKLSRLFRRTYQQLPKFKNDSEYLE